MQVDIFLKKKLHNLSFILLLGTAVLGAIILTEYDVAKGFSSVPAAIQWALSNFYPDSESMEKFPDIFEKLVETVLISVAATTSGAALALLFAIAGSSTTQFNRFLGQVSRTIATVFRNIDMAVWSMILLFSFGQSAFTGYFALFFGSFGFLTRAFIESIDEVGDSSVEALRATGAGYFSIIFQSVIPSSISQMISWILFMIETNIRSATLIGILTGTGIGFAFSMYYKSLDYNAASLVVLVIVAAIFIIEWVSNYVRRVIL
ncbi:ABC transporter permease subunit [Bacillus thermotolerans]|uniref:Phosphonate ABC transporter permease protein phnE2 n=1 Tax=Bacillus thermotolerans TaxID=1221996 RepID=A0A0F5HXN0_BACTR|nr:ABC transporter permease subunit [Bacillus thermotolerans]KKB38041.1 Phosphonate ABC transporter permease protein phnE2 [Bacillus thermotolerans]KKB40702.1 Phosphonate ABC transporter permease protein phnE2 [Bacillus thermotolerans]